MRILLFVIYIFWLPVNLLAQMLGRDPLQLKDPGGKSYWLNRAAVPSRQSYFSESSETEGQPTTRVGDANGRRLDGGSPMLARLLRAIARLYAPPRIKANMPVKSAADREKGVPDEIYTLW